VIKVITSAAEDAAAQDAKRRENVFFFLGADPAPAANKKSDDGALVTLRAEPLVENPIHVKDWRLDFVWAYKVRAADGPTWSGLIHRKHQHFRYSAICMDYLGGGQWVRPELAKKTQKFRDVEFQVTPIACIEDEATMVNAEFILFMFSRGDSKIQKLWGDMVMRGEANLPDKAHQEFLEAFHVGAIGLPQKTSTLDPKTVDGWSEERRWAAKMIELMASQLTNISVRTEDNGETYYDKNGARSFSAKGRKDFAYAGMYAFTAFLSWFRSRGEDDFAPKAEDAAMCSG
jgi:hypothetical protein